MTLMTLTSDIHSGSVSWNRFYWWGSQSHGSMIRRSPTIGNQRRKPASKSPLRTPHRTWRRRPGEEDLEKKMGTPLTPAHVLVLAHSTTDQSIDSTFDGAGRNSFVSISPLSVADDVNRRPRLTIFSAKPASNHDHARCPNIRKNPADTPKRVDQPSTPVAGQSSAPVHRPDGRS
jgi:hypothetical protein